MVIKSISTVISQLTRKSILVFIDQGIVSGGNFVITLLLARYLGLENFGVFALGWMLVLCCSSIQQALVIAPLYSLLPKANSASNFIEGLHSFQIIISTLILVFGSLILWVVIYYDHFNIPISLWWVLPLLAFAFVMNDFYRRLFFSMNKPNQTLGTDLFIYVLQIGLIFTLNYFDQLTIKKVYLSFFGVYLLAVLRNGSMFSIELEFKRNLKLAKQVWAYSKFLFGTSLLQWLSGNFFIIASGSILSPLIVGVIRVAQNVVGILNVLFLALENIVPLNGARILTELGERAAMRYFSKTFWRIGWGVTGLLVVLGLAREFILDVLYGSHYSNYSDVLLGFTVIYFLVFINTFLAFIIRTFEWNKVFFITYIVTSSFSVIVANYFIKEWGVLGVIGGLLAIQSINFLAYSIWIRNKITWI